MTLPVRDLLLYAGAVFVLFLTPGPVWMALAARTLSGGFKAAWPLALGVVVGDMAWPVVAIIGVGWAAASAQIAVVLKAAAAVMLVVMGLLTIRNSGRALDAEGAVMRRLTQPGRWAGFSAGVAVILSNPKAVLFYMGLLPGFFDLSRVNGWDIAAIVLVSQMVPLAGNLGLAALVHRVRMLMASPRALRRANLTAGAMLILVGLIIPFA